MNSLSPIKRKFTENIDSINQIVDSEEENRSDSDKEVDELDLGSPKLP